MISSVEMHPRLVLFVCTGNTCRSPMAEGIMRNLLPEDWTEKISVKSAGILAIGGLPPSELAYVVCKGKGIDIADHVSRTLSEEMVAESDIILTMERRHGERTSEIGGVDKTWLITDFPGMNGKGKEIEDPIGMDTQAYETVFRKLEDEISRIIRYIVTS